MKHKDKAMELNWKERWRHGTQCRSAVCLTRVQGERKMLGSTGPEFSKTSGGGGQTVNSETSENPTGQTQNHT